MPLRSALLDALGDRPLVFDGAMGTQIQASELTPGDFTFEGRHLEGCNEILNLTRPAVVEGIHRSYLDVGVDLIETNTFGATSIVLGEYGVAHLVRELSRAGADIARRAAAESVRQRFVVGAVGPGTKLVSLGQTSWTELEATYKDAAIGLLEGGVDALLLETLQDLLMAKAGVVAFTRAMAETERHVPLFVQVTMEQTGTMLLGSEMAAALNMLECFSAVSAIGLNCATGPLEMTPHVRLLSQSSTRPITVQPNAGLPFMEHGKSVYPLSPLDLAQHHERFVTDFGVAMVGGCCGTTPQHMKMVVDAMAGCPSAERRPAAPLIGCSSLYQFVPYRQDNSYLIVGEKTNANGSRTFRDKLAVDDWDGLTEIAKELENEGSHVLDVCTAFVGRDEKADMLQVLHRYNRQITAPIMIDSTEAPVIEAALQTLAGKPIVNSINFEDGGLRAHRVLSLCREYGAGVVALTIDEDGMAKTAEKKLLLAERLLALTQEYGIPDHDVFLDCLTFTLGSGDEEFRRAAVETIQAIREVAVRHPAVNTLLGVSNISFGLKPAARQVLNSAFLHYAREAGLTSAIVHFSKIMPENRIDPQVWVIACDLVFDRRRFADAAP